MLSLRQGTRHWCPILLLIFRIVLEVLDTAEKHTDQKRKYKHIHFQTLQPYGAHQASLQGILQARILECVAMPSSRGSSWPRDRTRSLMSPAQAFRFFTTNTTWEVPCRNITYKKKINKFSELISKLSKVLGYWINT